MRAAHSASAAGSGAGPARGAGRPALVAAGRFGRGQRAAHRVWRSQRGRRCPGPVGCLAPFGERGPDGVALACRGLGPVVLGVGDLAGGGNRQLLAAEHEPPRRVIAQVTESTSGLNARPHSAAAHGASGRAGSCQRPGRSPATCTRSHPTATQTQPIHAEPAIGMGRHRIDRNHVEQWGVSGRKARSPAVRAPRARAVPLGLRSLIKIVLDRYRVPPVLAAMALSA